MILNSQNINLLVILVCFDNIFILIITHLGLLTGSSNRHEKPTDPDDPLADQNIKDRYYGINDPVADKLLKRASTMPRLDPPEDKSISTLYIGGLGDTVTDGDLK